MRKRFYVVIGVVAVLVYAGLIEPYWIAERTYDLGIRGFGGDSLTIVHIADIHTRRLGFRERQTIERIEQIDPDYVFVSGDLIKEDYTIRAGLDFLAKLKARCGVYFVAGNADREIVSGIGAGTIARETATYRILINESVDCGDFVLVGIDDPVTHRDDVARAFEGVSGSKPVFALTHFHPDSLLWQLEARGVDLVFSGHTHGGQVGLAMILELVPYAYRSRFIGGLYELNRFHLSVTKGVGTNIFPMRLLCRPEIVILRLKQK
jgi:predicted MPP superfamily phosphohydrolase